MELHPCGRCRRHVRGATCPFCGAAQTALLTKLVQAGGRLSRAAVFAGAAACYTNATPTEQQTSPPPPPPPDGEQFAQPPPDDGLHGADRAVAATGTIEGEVSEAGTLMPGIVVQLEDARGNAAQARTDQQGKYVFKGLAPGRYTLKAMVNQNTRQGPPQRSVTVEGGKVAQVSFAVVLSVPDRGPCCKPYGAPPARRRVV